MTTVEKIHRKFDTASDKILKDAKAIIAKSETNDKAKRLRQLGFTCVKEVVDLQSEFNNKERNRQLILLIEEYQIKYPNNKFITEEVVNKICKTYSLLFSVVSNYKGDVPENNITEIEQFVKDNSIEMAKGRGFMDSLWQFTISIDWNVINNDTFGENRQHFSDPFSNEFKICAPKKDFIIEGKTRKGYELINDPVVLYPVKGGYLIVTKWGIEAEDKELLNEKMN